MRRYRRRKNSDNAAEITALAVFALFGYFFRFNLDQLRQYSVFAVFILIAMVVLIMAAVLYVRKRRQDKLKALEMIDVAKMPGHEFEEYLAFLLRSQGFINTRVTRYQGDFGADIIAEKDGKKYAIQAKRYRGLVGVDALYQCFGGQKYYGCDIAMVVTNADYTKQAYELALKSKTTLINGSVLADWILQMKSEGKTSIPTN